ncbi:hypothetical protein Pfl01_2950 [Pseudomonas fluorescens Pf0-1]|uniref:Uncharacterized protein n=1 Tax=Pseudomonas fluorescens (strain Pf0-1) TaxID=205922 RepID=Q3KC14_PSEPF|nr:hypothetical protein Pfl01_2950 [Pseudomonas fluorescens Pf0-1]
MSDKLIDILIREDDLEDLRHNKRCHRLRHLYTTKRGLLRALSFLGFGKTCQRTLQPTSWVKYGFFDQRLIFRMVSCLHLRASRTGIKAASARSAGSKAKVVISLRRCPTNYTQTKKPLSADRLKKRGLPRPKPDAPTWWGIWFSEIGKIKDISAHQHFCAPSTLIALFKL